MYAKPECMFVRGKFGAFFWNLQEPVLYNKKVDHPCYIWKLEISHSCLKDNYHTDRTRPNDSGSLITLNLDIPWTNWECVA